MSHPLILPLAVCVLIRGSSVLKEVVFEAEELEPWRTRFAVAARQNQGRAILHLRGVDGMWHKVYVVGEPEENEEICSEHLEVKKRRR